MKTYKVLRFTGLAVIAGGFAFGYDGYGANAGKPPAGGVIEQHGMVQLWEKTTQALDGGVRFWGQDFFGTVTKPLVEFDAGEDAVRLATAGWARFLETGQLSEGQIRASLAKDAAAFFEAFRRKKGRH